MLNPKWLITFETLADTQSFTKTAECLFMTQPGVSQHIKKLEDTLGETLIFREGKQFELSQAGTLLKHYIASQKQLKESFLAQLKDDNPNQGPIRIACSGAMAMKLYPLLLAHQQQHPDLSVHIEAAPASRIHALLMDNQIDIGISTQPISHPSIEETLMGKESLCLVVPAASQVDPHDYLALCELGFIQHPDASQYADLVLSKNYPKQYRGLDGFRDKGYVNQLAQILLPVSQGLGFTVLPGGVVDSFVDRDKLSCLTLRHPVYQQVYLAQKRYRNLPQRYAKIIEIIEVALA
ncbi:LysR family transcriptional regulator [Enterovibrio calviensis]|uniref:LysR family transcriptional regulator n=1 Tax=Enterovibrio calviensis TaxID=91359 RepID=UPI000481C027|nr:LysR family transcriptional regulator [Enterovibrio calviensis]